ncbi:C-reactive protein-like [Chiloscyllium plagiosum]|uniref:C-reactive protein-like n=1 Tax=Chiloscyllium plagiosum TaxID=36176 RepID=UPI001CB851E1|nr:C-reactive protein-like [Chiloscyllium plagiosum]XP_043573886.1 C-reactive protein-like [Chiloscyllium plagiosum]
MKTCFLSMFVVCLYLPVSDSAGLAGKSLTFPVQTKDSYVQLKPERCPDLSAFTLCLRAASAESRNYGLFSYASSQHDNELMLFKASDTRLDLYLQDIVIPFCLPAMDTLMRHICVTWESGQGEVTFWVNGQRSVRKVGRKGSIVKGRGTYILGQEQDKVGGGFDIDQSFVGEVSDVNLWDHVLTPSEIKAVSEGCYNPGGSIIDWSSVWYIARGKVKIQDNKDCTV